MIFLTCGFCFVNRTVFFEETDTRPVRVAFADIAGRRTDGNASKAHVGEVTNAVRRLVRTSRKHYRAAEMKRTASIRKSHHATERLAQVRARAHQRNHRRKTRYMLQGIVTEFRVVMENSTNKRKHAVARPHVILMVDAFIVHD